MTCPLHLSLWPLSMDTSDVVCTCEYLKIFALMVPEALLPACAGAQCRDSMV